MTTSSPTPMPGLPSATKASFLHLRSWAFLSLLVGLLLFNGCKPENTGGSSKYALVIENGAQSIAPNGNLTYTAHLVDVNGNVKPATGIKWSVAEGSVASIDANGLVSVAGAGVTTVTASVDIDGATIKATVPLQVATPSVFAVGPSAIMGTAGFTVDLIPVFLGATGVTYEYAVDNNSVASVSSSGRVTLNGSGSANITVTAKSSQGNPTVNVPVLVIGEPVAPIPVTRIDVIPGFEGLFRNQTATFTAQAYKGNSPTNASFSWSSSDPNIASVDANGKVTAHSIGEVDIMATAQGVVGKAEVQVSPDTIVIVSPFMAMVPAGGTKQYTATVMNVRNNPPTTLTGVAINWQLPTFDVPGFDNLKIGSVDQNGKVTVKSDALAGISSVVIATVQGNPTAEGAAAVVVSPFTQDCGSGNASVASIVVSNGSSVSLSLTGSPQLALNVVAKDAGGNAVGSPALKFNSADPAVCTVDDNGNISATGPGSTTITICSGSYASVTINVSVSF